MPRFEVKVSDLISPKGRGNSGHKKLIFKKWFCTDLKKSYRTVSNTVRRPKFHEARIEKKFNKTFLVAVFEEKPKY